MSFRYRVHVAHPINNDQPICGAQQKNVVLTAKPSMAYPPCADCLRVLAERELPKPKTTATLLMEAFAEPKRPDPQAKPPRARRYRPTVNTPSAVEANASLPI